MRMNITVYLGANEGNDPALRRAVEELGRFLPRPVYIKIAAHQQRKKLYKR